MNTAPLPWPDDRPVPFLLLIAGDDVACVELGAVSLRHGVELGTEAFSYARREEGGVVALALRPTDGDLATIEVDVLDAQDGPRSRRRPPVA